MEILNLINSNLETLVKIEKITKIKPIGKENNYEIKFTREDVYAIYFLESDKKDIIRLYKRIEKHIKQQTCSK